MVDIPADQLQKILNDNPVLLLAGLENLMKTQGLGPMLDTVTNNPPFNFPDNSLFKIGETDVSIYSFMGVALPLIFIGAILLFMRNCYGYVFLFLWVVVLAIFGAFAGILFRMEMDYKNQINLAAKYVLMFVSVLFGALTLIGFTLRLLSVPFQVIASPLAAAPVPVSAPLTPQAAPLVPVQQAGGSKKGKGPPRMIYIAPRR
jgi:hypothetical protein